MEQTQPDRGTILAVDDNITNLKIVTEHLLHAGFKVLSARNGESGIQRARLAQPDLILLDVQMPDLNGFEVCRRLKAEEAVKDIPVIFMTALNSVEDKLQGFAVGGVDYIPKPFEAAELLARVETHLLLYKQRRQIAELQQKERAYFLNLNQLKNQFVSTASHDLKNPIGIIKSYVELIEETSPELDSDVKKYLERIKYGADQMLNLVKDLLDLTRMEMGATLELRQIALSTFLTERLSDFELLAWQKKITLTSSLPQINLQVSFDTGRMTQVINNLLSNALKYTPAGGEIKLAAYTQNGKLFIEISDNGLGIPAEDLPHLFDKFYRVRREKHLAEEGTGLGLAIVKTLVEKHDGQIQVKSTLGEGTTFSIIFPLYNL